MGENREEWEMGINRNQYFALGVVVLLVGIQFRYVESFTLNTESTDFIRTRIAARNTPALATTNSSFSDYFSQSAVSQSNINIKPPKWVGWALLSMGGVLILHSFAMQKPD